jgi:hypothetical protein
MKETQSIRKLRALVRHSLAFTPPSAKSSAGTQSWIFQLLSGSRIAVKDSVPQKARLVELTRWNISVKDVVACRNMLERHGGRNQSMGSGLNGSLLDAVKKLMLVPNAVGQ